MIISEEFWTKLSQIRYRFRHIVLFTIFGVFAIAIELVSRQLLTQLDIASLYATPLSIIIGILVAFVLNIRFNFSIPRHRILRALTFFVAVSIASISAQAIFREWIGILEGGSYEWSRIVFAGAFFLIAYVLHRKLSFRDTRLVGVAVYASEHEDISGIRARIGTYADFIHVDIVDATMNPLITEVRAHRAETIKAHWPSSEIQAHVMSRRPSQWIAEVGPYCDVIYVHRELEEDRDTVRDMIAKHGARPGVVVHINDKPTDLAEELRQETEVLLLCIDRPGHSGQVFEDRSYDFIKFINALENRASIRLCVDGGINDKNISNVDSDLIVSGSYVLNALDPKRAIMRLQTLNQYDREY